MEAEDMKYESKIAQLEKVVEEKNKKIEDQDKLIAEIQSKMFSLFFVSDLNVQRRISFAFYIFKENPLASPPPNHPF